MRLKSTSKGVINCSKNIDFDRKSILNQKMPISSKSEYLQTITEINGAVFDNAFQEQLCRFNI